MKRFLAICLLLNTTSFAQKSYWQQHVATNIEVKLDDKKHILNGYEELVYTNNSPDTLRFLYIHLFPNAYKNDHTPFAKQQDLNHNSDFYYSKPSNRGYMDSLQFTVNGKPADHYCTESAPDIARLDLPTPLLPGQEIKIATPFRVKLPWVFSRNGHTGQAYYVSQWFPKPAVYDSKGWHPISYLDQGEFFSEYGSYDVAITLPDNYVVMATGNCTDKAENDRLDSLAKLPLPSDTLYRKHFPASSLQTRTVHYHEDNVHDFAWFADKRYIVRKDTVSSPGTGKLITTWTAFMPTYQEKWKNGNKYLADAVRHYGKWVGPYPYNTIKAVLGDMKSGGGMEYPTITLIDRVASSSLETVLVHEAGHNWFYGMLGSNEREHAWMDEGLNSFYEQKTTRALHNDTTGKRNKGLDESMIYYQLARTNEDQAIATHSERFRNMTNYGMDVYYKTALMLGWLEKYMGKEHFEEGMKDYFKTWCFSHPYPEDLRAVLQKHTDKQLDWFFDTMLHTTRSIDFAITKARTHDQKTTVTISNRTGVAGPVHVIAYDKNDSITGSAWTSPFDNKATTEIPGTNWSRLRIDNAIPDARSANDEYRRRALFHRFGIALKPIAGLNRSYKDKIYIAPALAQNRYDGVMAGLLFHNMTLPENRFAFAVAPMFSFNTETLTGAGSVGYSWYPRNTFKSVMLIADAKSFHSNSTDINLKEPIYTRYLKVAPSIEFTFKEKDPQSQATRTLVLKEYNISEESFNFGTDSTAIPTKQTAQNTYFAARYQHRNDRMYNPFSYSVQAHGNSDFAKLNLEGNIRIDYYARKKSLYVRGYFGKFFGINNNPAVTQRYWLNASYSGINDYLYDGTYRARLLQDGFQGQQISPTQEGGFKVPIYNGAYRTDNWLAALNLKTDLPKIGLPIRLFVDAGLVPNPTPGFKNVKNTLLLYDAGIEIYLSKEVAFYFPLIMSQDFRSQLSNTFGNKNVFVHSISFTLELHNINWLRTPARLMKTVSGG
jgi:hypothetical protein